MGETSGDEFQGEYLLPLSVSSNGSNWVKLWSARAAVREAVKAFSILERIELGETRQYHDTKEKAVHFQYPRTDRIG